MQQNEQARQIQHTATENDGNEATQKNTMVYGNFEIW